MNAGDRLVFVGYAFLNSLSSSSVLQFGDTIDSVNLTDWVLAIQRAKANFYRDELAYSSYNLFYLPNLVPTSAPPVRFSSCSRNGSIQVGSSRITGASSSSFIRYGNGGGPVTSESRIVNIRHFNAGAPADFRE